MSDLQLRIPDIRGYYDAIATRLSSECLRLDFIITSGALPLKFYTVRTANGEIRDCSDQEEFHNSGESS